MRDLLKIAVVLALAFASTFVIATLLLPEASLLDWLKRLRDVPVPWLMLAVVGLLVFDLVVAVPTMATILLAGWLLGPWLGGATAALGLMLMGAGGYGMGRIIGRRALRGLLRDEARLAAIETAFARNDVLTLAVCQALPILPELSATLAGIARTPPLRFAFGYGVGVIPFAFVVAAGGAASSPDDLRPAVLVVIGVSGGLLLAWRLLIRGGRRVG